MPKLAPGEWEKLQVVYCVGSGTKCFDEMAWKPGQMKGRATPGQGWIFSTLQGARDFVLNELTYEGQQFPWIALEFEANGWYTEITGGGHWYRWVIITEQRVYA